MKVTKFRDTEGMAKDRRRPQTQRPRENRPADHPWTDAGARTPGDPGETVEAPRAEQPGGTVEHLPGEVHADPPVDLWPERTAETMRERWRDLQALFVDDPRAAAEQADAVLAETIGVLTDSLQAARSDLSEWRNRQDADTEGLRVALRRSAPSWTVCWPCSRRDGSRGQRVEFAR